MTQIENLQELSSVEEKLNRASAVVIGGGITGLAAAHRLREIDARRRIVVLEAGPNPGGVLRAVRKEAFLIEESADSFLTALPSGLSLCRRLRLEDEIIPTD